MAEMMENMEKNCKSDQIERKVHLWVEDSAAGYDLWRWLSVHVFSGVTLCPESPQRGRWNIDELIKEVRLLKDTEDIHIILPDDPVNNRELRVKISLLKKEMAGNPNIMIIGDYICYESVLLSFSLFEDWVYRSRNKTISLDHHECLEMFRKGLISGDYDECTDAIIKARELYPNSKIDTFEQLAKVLLSHLTQKATGFIANEKILGNCWTSSCDPCDYTYLDCKLFLSSEEKARSVYRNSYISEIFNNKGVQNVTDICI